MVAEPARRRSSTSTRCCRRGPLRAGLRQGQQPDTVTLAEVEIAATCRSPTGAGAREARRVTRDANRRRRDAPRRSSPEGCRCTLSGWPTHAAWSGRRAASRAGKTVGIDATTLEAQCGVLAQHRRDRRDGNGQAPPSRAGVDVGVELRDVSACSRRGGLRLAVRRSRGRSAVSGPRRRAPSVARLDRKRPKKGSNERLADWTVGIRWKRPGREDHEKMKDGELARLDPPGAQGRA